MSKVKTVTADTTLVVPDVDVRVEQLALCAAGATSTVEIFDGTIGTIATTALGVGGASYAVNDLFHLVQSEGGVVATGRVDTVLAGVVLTFTILTFGTGYVAGTTYATVHDSGVGNDALTVTVSTITDAGVSIGKLSCLTNTSDTALVCAVARNGVSVRITGTSAKAYIYYG